MQKFVRIYTPEGFRDMACEKLTYEEARKIVGGYLEMHRIGSDLVVLCDEDGRMKQLEPSVSINGVTYVGAVVICEAYGGDFCGVTKTELRNFERWGLVTCKH